MISSLEADFGTHTVNSVDSNEFLLAGILRGLYLF